MDEEQLMREARRMRREVLSVSIDPDVIASVTNVAEQEGVSRSRLVERVLRRYLASAR
jgi:metal-responsive CopG/Arc/MetJ family transcriptional regulator